MITLRVAEAKSRDTLRGKVRINNQAMKELGISTGEIVKINGPVNYTAAVVWPAYPEDLKRNIIRMDEQIRKNAGVGVAENVVLEIVPIEKAKKVVLQKVKVNFSTDFGFDNFVKRKLKGYPMTKGDFITIPVLMDDNPFKVREILPQDEIVILGEFTEIIVVDSSYLDSIEKEELENRKRELLTLFMK